MPIVVDLPQRANLRLLLALRIALLCGAVVAAYDATLIFGAQIDLTGLLAMVALFLVVSAFSWTRMARGLPVGKHEIHAQIIVDVLGLTAILYFAGGASNPFTLLYLIPVSMAAAALSSRVATWSVVALSIGCYTLLLIIPAAPAPHVHDHDLPSPDQLHLWGMWVGFVASSCLIAFFAVSARRMIREKDIHLAQERERAMRDRQLVELGTLAAGAAHELGTPLGTLAILADDLRQEHPDSSTIQQTALIMTQQIQRCKDSLAVLSARAGQQRAESGRLRPADQYVTEIVADWKSSRPDVNPVLTTDGGQPPPLMIADMTLTHAITNILNNAADASPQNVEVHARWEGSEVWIDILDRGPGFAPEARERVGKLVFTTKQTQGGLGIGAFLAYATIDRIGGTVQILQREGGGSRVRIGFDLNFVNQTTRGDSRHVDNSTPSGGWHEALTTGR